MGPMVRCRAASFGRDGLETVLGFGNQPRPEGVALGGPPEGAEHVVKPPSGARVQVALRLRIVSWQLNPPGPRPPLQRVCDTIPKPAFSAHEVGRHAHAQRGHVRIHAGSLEALRVTRPEAVGLVTY